MGTFAADDVAKEIQRCLRRIAKDFAGSGNREKWTKLIKVRLTELGRDHKFAVCASGVNDKAHWGEFVYDLCWLKYVSYYDTRDPYEPTDYLLRVPLVMESEWGNEREISDDFEKILMARADLRVMIFQHDKPADIDDITRHLTTYIRRFRPRRVADRYLFCGYINARNKFQFALVDGKGAVV